MCNIPSYETSKCNSRHPKICSYFRNYGKCKFGDWCSYQHKRNSGDNYDPKYEEIFEKIIKLEEALVEKDNKMRNLCEKIDKIE